MNIQKKEKYDNDIKSFSSLPLHYSRDVCLGKLNTKTRKWECTGLNFNVEEKNNLQLTGELNENGIYAVILHLKINDNKLKINENWIIAPLIINSSTPKNSTHPCNTLAVPVYNFSFVESFQ